MAVIQQKVEDIINNNKVAIFSKSYCPYCRRAKEALKGLAEYFSIELDQVEDGAAIQEYLSQKTGQRTVPNIFINQKHIGGSDDLLSLKASGELQKLLA
ncbi:thioredoxin-like protein [Umbelopsis sp. PMI_123]|nr:thioredoxin-like protein [Umbelopsis sp. PMI_123]